MKRGRESDEDNDDEDYDPTKDTKEQIEAQLDLEEEKREKNAKDQEASVVNEIRDLARSRKVDDVWSQMKREEAAQPLKVPASALSAKAKPARKKRKSDRKAKMVLGEIFGPTVAGELLRKVSGEPGSKPPAAPKEGASKGAAASGASASTKAALAAAVAGVQRSVTVTEKAVFAGQEVMVKKRVEEAAAQPVKPSSSLDAALNSLTGPTKMNTVAKSSADWEGYKEESGMADDLEKAAQDGYLAKKEFLERCDVRAFEQEKDQRLTGKKGN